MCQLANVLMELGDIKQASEILPLLAHFHICLFAHYLPTTTFEKRMIFSPR